MDAQEKVDKRSLPETVAKRQATIRARFGVDSAMQASSGPRRFPAAAAGA